MKKIVALVIVAVLAGVAGAWYAARDRGPEPAPEIEAAESPEFRPEFSLPDLDGNTRAFSEWDGRLTIVNFWATWCAPCRREIPVLIDIQAEHGDDLAVLGVAIDDMDAVRAYVEEMEFNYPTLVGQSDAIQVARAFGNRVGALPFTAIVDADGAIRWIHAGEFNAEELDAALAPLLD